MAVLTGVLVDVSGSMERSIGGKVEEEGGSWARSIFKVVDDLIKNDVTESNHVFALGVGASSKPEVFDLLNTVKKAKDSQIDTQNRRKEAMIEDVLDILEGNGAPWVRTWANPDKHIIISSVTDSEAAMILNMLQCNSTFRWRFVGILPLSCRVQMGGGFLGSMVDGGIGMGMKVTAWCVDKKDSVKEVIEKGKALLKEHMLVSVDDSAVMTVPQAHSVLHGCVGRDELTDERVDELMEAVKPFIFGGTPLIKALDHAKALFSLPQYGAHHKLLFVLSDGQPTDGNNPPLRAFSDLGVTVVSCFITDRSISDPLQLYSREDQRWEKPAKFMFQMSSTIKTEWIPRTIFVKRGWKIDIQNNETKLFCQVNHPDIIKDVCDLARNIVCCQDALSDILASVSLDVYINHTKERFGAKRQKGATCYANACAAVLHLAMSRIVGRTGEYPDFFEIRAKLIDKYGKDGANTLQVLRQICPQFRLHCEEVGVVGAMEAVAAKRAVIARFRLTDPEWDSFSKFYEDNPRGILTQSQVDISKRPRGAQLGGHAVVLTSYDSRSLRFMNSWGSDWADGGFFRVQNAGVLGIEFDDVFWTLNDLTQEEKEAYTRCGPKIAKKLLASLQGLQTAKYKCPLCLVESKLEDFTGHLRGVKCRKCGGTFCAKDAGDDLVLNMYLTSLSH